MMEVKNEYIWSEKYRPTKVADCILPDRFKAIFQKYADDRLIPQHILMTGGPGAGKTTIALAMCAEAKIDHLFINSSKERGIDTLRTKIVQYASTRSLSGTKKVIILDEADYLTPDAQSALRGVMEEFSSNCTFILTCNFKAKLMDALHSRCVVIDFQLKGDEKVKMASAFFKRLEAILTNENVTYDKPALVKIVEKYFPDFRRTLNELQGLAAQYGKIDAGAIGTISIVKNIAELIKYLKNKDFSNMRKWVVENGDIDPSRLYRKVYDSLYQYLDPSSIPQAVLIIAKYQYQSAFVGDQEINLVACLTEMMVDCTYQ